MTLTLSARNERLVRAGHLRAVPLVVLTTYSNYSAKTVDKVYYFSSSDLWYDYGNTGTNREFLGAVSGMGQLTQRIPHIPSPQRGTQLRRSLDFTLLNLELPSGTRLITDMRTHTLAFATVEVSELPIEVNTEHPDAERDAWRDQTGLVGDEHIVRFRGEVRQVAIDEAGAIAVQCRSTVPSFPRNMIAADRVETRHRGAVIPHVYGDAKAVRGWNWTIGRLVWSDGVFLSASETTRMILNGVSFETVSQTVDPTEPGYAYIVDATNGDEIIGYTDITELFSSDPSVPKIALNTLTRGLFGTSAVSHTWSDTATTAVLLGTDSYSLIQFYAVTPCLGLGPMFVQDGFTDEPFEVGTGWNTELAISSYSTAEGTISWGGWNVVAAFFTSEQLASLRQAFITETRMTKQAVYELASTPAPTLHVEEITPTDTSVSTTLYLSRAKRGVWSNIATATPDWQGNDDSGDDQETLVAAVQSGDYTYGSEIILRWRYAVACECTTIGPELNWLRLYFQAKGMPGGTKENSIRWNAGGTFPSTKTFVSKWFVGDGSTTVADMVTDNARLQFFWDMDVKSDPPSTGDAVCELQSWFLEVESQASASGSQIQLASAAEVSGLTSDLGWEFFADVRGPSAPTTGYTVGAGGDIHCGVDILQYIIRSTFGLSSAYIDSTSFGLVGANMFLNEHGVIAEEFAPDSDFETFCDAIAFEFRTQLVQDERAANTVYRALAANVDWTWGTSSGHQVLTQWNRLAERGRPIEALANRFRFLWDQDNTQPNALDGFQQVFRAGADASDFGTDPVTFSTLETKWGRRDAAPLNFRTVHDADTIEELAGYYVTAMTREDVEIDVRGVPWVESATIEIGDVVSLTLPWESAAKKWRVVGLIRDMAAGTCDFELVEVEVPTT